MAGELNLSLIVRAIDRATRPLQRIGRAVQQVSRQTGLDVVARRAARLRSSLGETGRQFGAFARRAGAITGVIGAAGFGLTGKFAAFADDVLKTSRRLGLGTDALQRWRYAAKLSGISTQTFDMAMQRFGRRAAEAAAGTGEAKDALEFLRREYGVMLRDAEGSMRPVEDIFEDVVEAMSKIEDPLLRNRAAMKLFDSEGVAMVQMMGKGREGLRRMGDEADSLGLVFPREQLEQGEAYTDAFTRMKESLSALGNAIGVELLPMMQKIVEQVAEWSQQARPEIVEQVKLAFADLGAVLDWIGNAFGRIGEAVGSFLDWLETTHPAVAEWIGRLREGAEGMGAFRLAVAGIVAWLGAKFVFAVARSIVSMLLFGGSVIYAAVRTAMLAAALIGQGAWSLASAFWRLPRAIGFAARAVWGFTASLLLNPVFLIGAAIAAAAAGIGYAAYLIYKYWRDIPAFFAGVWKAVISGLKGLPAWFMGIWDRVEGFGLLDTVKGWFAQVVPWVTKTWGEIKSAFDVAGWIEAFEGFGLLDTVKGWFAQVVPWVTKTWGEIKSAFDVAGWIEAFEGFGLLDTVKGWFAQVVPWVTKTWGEIKSAFDVAGWIEAFEGFGLLDTVKGWFAQVVPWVTKTWGEIKSAFDVAGWIEAFEGFGLLDTVKGWFAQVVPWVTKTWGEIKSAFDVAGWIEAFEGFGLLDTVKGWFAQVVPWVTKTWGEIKSAFDVAGWIEAFEGFGLLDTVKGWFAQVVPWVTKTWGEIKSAFDVAGWIEAFEGFGLLDTVKGWFAQVVPWVTKTWGEIKSAFDVAGWIEAFEGFGLLDTVKGWFAQVVPWVTKTWGEIKSAFDVAGWIEAFEGFGLLDTVKGWFAQVVPWVTKTWGEIKSAIGIEALVKWLETFDFWQIGMDWVDGLWAGMVAGWGEFVAWVSSAIDHLMGPINWLMRQFGVSDQDEAASIAAANENAPARIRALAAAGPAEAVPSALGGLAPPLPSAIGPGSEALQGGVSVQQIAEIVRVVVGGEVRVAFENSPQGMRVQSVRSDNPDIDIDVTAGYSMAGS